MTPKEALYLGRVLVGHWNTRMRQANGDAARAYLTGHPLAATEDNTLMVVCTVCQVSTTVDVEDRQYDTTVQEIAPALAHMTHREDCSLPLTMASLLATYRKERNGTSE